MGGGEGRGMMAVRSQPEELGSKSEVYKGSAGTVGRGWGFLQNAGMPCLGESAFWGKSFLFWNVIYPHHSRFSTSKNASAKLHCPLYPRVRASRSTCQISCTPSLKYTTLYSTSPLRPSNVCVGISASNASCGVIKWHVTVVSVDPGDSEADADG